MEPVNKNLLILILPDRDIELAKNGIPGLVLAHYLVIGYSQFLGACRAEWPKITVANEPVPLRVKLDPFSQNIVELVLLPRSYVRAENFDVGSHDRGDEQVEKNHLEQHMKNDEEDETNSLFKERKKRYYLLEFNIL